MRYKRLRVIRPVMPSNCPHGEHAWQMFGQAKNNRWVYIASGIAETEEERDAAIADAQKRWGKYGSFGD